MCTISCRCHPNAAYILIGVDVNAHCQGINQPTRHQAIAAQQPDRLKKLFLETDLWSSLLDGDICINCDINIDWICVSIHGLQGAQTLQVDIQSNM